MRARHRLQLLLRRGLVYEPGLTFAHDAWLCWQRSSRLPSLAFDECYGAVARREGPPGLPTSDQS